MKQPKLRRQWQCFSEKDFEAVVRYEVQRCFYKRFLTDCRVRKLLDRIPERQLIDNINRLFFQSFSEVFVDLSVPTKTKIYVTWYNTYDKLSVGPTARR